MPVPPTVDIAYRPDVAQAFLAEYYRAKDAASGSGIGVLVDESVPFDRGWTVKARLDAGSLQTSVQLTAIALCAPKAPTQDDEGVLGVSLRSGSGRAACGDGELLSAVGFTSGGTGSIQSLVVSGNSATGDGWTTLTAVCIDRTGMSQTTASGSKSVTGGWDDAAYAGCPSGYVATGGGMKYVDRPLGSGAAPRREAAFTAGPISGSTFAAGIRAAATSEPTGPTLAPLLDLPVGRFAYPLVGYTDYNHADVTAYALCIKRSI